MTTVAAHVAVAVENALNFEEARSYQQLLLRERDRLRLLLEVNNHVISHLELGDLFQAVSSALRDCFHHEYTGLWLFEEGTTQLRCVGMDFPRQSGVHSKTTIGGLDACRSWRRSELASPSSLNERRSPNFRQRSLHRFWRRTSARECPFLWSPAQNRSAS